MQHYEQQVGGFLGTEGVRLAVTDKFVAHPVKPVDKHAVT